MKKLTAAAAVAAAALSLSACGGDTKTATSTSTSTSAATGSGSASSASSTSMSTSTSSSSSSANGGGTASSLADAQVGQSVDAIVIANTLKEAFKDGSTGHMSMDMGGIAAEGDFKVVGTTQNSTMKIDMGGNSMEVRSVDGVTYMKSPLFAGGTKWVKGNTATGAPNVNAFDPETLSKSLEGQSAKVTAKEGGTTTIVMDLDMKKLLGSMGSDLSSLGTAAANIPASVPLTYVIDADNRPLSASFEMSGAPVQVKYSDWGKGVSIEAPPASEVTTM